MEELPSRGGAAPDLNAKFEPNAVERELADEEGAEKPGEIKGERDESSCWGGSSRWTTSSTHEKLDPVIVDFAVASKTMK